MRLPLWKSHSEKRKNLSFTAELNEDCLQHFPFSLDAVQPVYLEEHIWMSNSHRNYKKRTHLHRGKFIEHYVFILTDLMVSKKLNAHCWKTNWHFLQKSELLFLYDYKSLHVVFLLMPVYGSQFWDRTVILDQLDLVYGIVLSVYCLLNGLDD